MGSLANLDFCSAGLLQKLLPSSCPPRNYTSVSHHLSHVRRPATGGSTGRGGTGLFLLMFVPSCLLPSGLACIAFLRAARNARTTKYRLRVPFFAASSGVLVSLLLACAAVFVRLSSCRGSGFYEQFRKRASTQRSVLSRQCCLLHPSPARPALTPLSLPDNPALCFCK